MSTLYEMLDAVNEAKTHDDYLSAHWALHGWLDCATQHGIEWSGIQADLYTMKKYGDDAPMTCGVLHRKFPLGA